MLERFSEEKFSKALSQKCPNPKPCVFCGSTNYMTYPKISHLQIQSPMSGMAFGHSIPCGILICSECGNINLFALGSLGLKAD